MESPQWLRQPANSDGITSGAYGWQQWEYRASISGGVAIICRPVYRRILTILWILDQNLKFIATEPTQNPDPRPITRTPDPPLSWIRSHDGQLNSTPVNSTLNSTQLSIPHPASITTLSDQLHRVHIWSTAGDALQRYLWPNKLGISRVFVALSCRQVAVLLCGWMQ